METKQLNARIPLFVHSEFTQLRKALRGLGTKPTDGDLVAALIHAAAGAVDETRAVVEQFVIDELAEEEREASR
jgi:hypothetical protein